MTVYRYLASAGLALALALTQAGPALAQGGPALSPDGPAQNPPPPEASSPPEAYAQEITFSGKLYCPVKYEVAIPYAINITAIHADLGKKVKRDENILEYEIHLDTHIDAKEKMTQAGIKEYEARRVEAEVQLGKLRTRRKELETLRARGMASEQALAINAGDIEAAEKQLAVIVENLTLERELFLVRQEMVRHQLGVQSATPKGVPKIGVVRSPIDGYVVWWNPEVRTGAYISERTKILEVGVMDPIILRALVHEIEVQKLQVGDETTVTFDSLPGKTFPAKVSRVPWVPAQASSQQLQAMLKPHTPAQPQPQTQDRVQTVLDQPSYYEVELTMSNPDLILKEGLKGQVTVLNRK
ncbi:MAG: HlyD family efflux transporter periplasmic adaptor subunit [Desulfovibrionaceae bacterium]|nr:HlyD family efflux transporter periplasmic adaptor subunit [Desulfovibrionaceae bacterium]MBF0514906.1 HlyD family efflux transporter periplasmic adaptor subunit [Desulfovibrionaceae bacterium]